MRPLFISVCVCVLLLSAPCAAAPGTLRTLIFTSNSFGEFAPCPTCGKGALGGLGRRAGLFEALRVSDPGALFVSGGWEFLSYSPRKKTRQEVLPALAEAYGLLGYDAGLVLPDEARALSRSEAALPPGFAPVQARPWTRTLEWDGLKLGLVDFPFKESAYASAPEALRDAVVQAAEELRPSVDLVLGLSPWGERDELALAEAHPGAFDVLLGSGPGTGYGVRAVQGRTVWVRSPFDGRGVMRLDILALPGDGDEWLEGRNFKAEALQLDAKVREDARVTNLFAWF
ncbi:UshA-like (seleno)protein family 2 [Desulfocurvus sp. DL9XJH121]